ncbi:MAG TPA: DUF131 domain-containing protein [Candidatus Methanoperedenaceae archaeon]|nr:DUF131 domain-containing protein [Candidatus Methanoperedenaceae archaeon]
MLFMAAGLMRRTGQEPEKTHVEGGGVIFIGPVPIIFGSNPRIALIIAVIAVVLMLMAIVYLIM